MSKTPAQRTPRKAKVFSGEASRPLWDTINRTQYDSRSVHDALYELGCACQELEAKVDKLLELPAARQRRGR